MTHKQEILLAVVVGIIVSFMWDAPFLAFVIGGAATAFLVHFVNQAMKGSARAEED